MELHHSAETEAPKKVTKLFLNRPLAEPQSRQDGFAIPHQLETRQPIDLFRRTSLAGKSISIDDPTFVSGARWPRRWITSSACIGWASGIDGFPRRRPEGRRDLDANVVSR